MSEHFESTEKHFFFRTCSWVRSEQDASAKRKTRESEATETTSMKLEAWGSKVTENASAKQEAWESEATGATDCDNNRNWGNSNDCED